MYADDNREDVPIRNVAPVASWNGILPLFPLRWICPSYLREKVEFLQEVLPIHGVLAVKLLLLEEVIELLFRERETEMVKHLPEIQGWNKTGTLFIKSREGLSTEGGETS